MAFTCLIAAFVLDYLFKNVYIREQLWKIEIVSPSGAKGILFSSLKNIIKIISPSGAMTQSVALLAEPLKDWDFF